VHDGLVDRFVLVEATRDHAGRDKPLHFAANKERFAKLLPKIIHVVVDDMPAGPDPWKRENHQRRAIQRGLEGCKSDDLILVSDLDEVPRPETLAKSLATRGLSFFMQDYHCYFINCRARGNPKWPGSALLRYANLKDAQWVRNLRSNEPTWLRRVLPPHLGRIDDGGWHFGYLGGVDAIIRKIESAAHNEFNREALKTPERILARMEQGLDLFLDGDQALRYGFTELDESYPQYLRDNRDRYRHLLHFSSHVSAGPSICSA
jgi:beta-1,4-mannosyl-glycoprotein beta-1,4-N-acetylglucosaminyltransferase